jgi:hypothetical protein
MEKIMEKRNDVSTLDHRPLADTELDAVTGGTLPGLGPIITDATGDALGNMLQTALKWLGGS